MPFPRAARKVRALSSRNARMTGLAAVFFAALAAAPAQANCNTSSDGVTLAVRQIQTHLMVAALSCGHSTQYNAFINRFAADIKSNADALNRYFSRQYGGSSKSQLNSYITRIANEASRTSMGNRQGFCEEANMVFQSLMATNPGHLASYATSNQPFSIQAGSCTTRTAQK